MHRKRMLDCFSFSDPDKIPVYYHPCTAGLHVHGQKLLDLLNEYPPDNPVTFEHIPGPPEDAVDQQGRYHEFRTDDWGVEWEYLVYGISGHPKTYPFNGWDEAKEYSFPPRPSADPESFRTWKESTEKLNEKYLTLSGWNSIFERIHDMQPFDNVLIDFMLRNPGLMEFLDRLTQYWCDVTEDIIEAGFDMVMFADDWGTQTAPLIPPALFTEVFKPRYERIMKIVEKAGRYIFFHTCGQVGPIFDELADLGINGLWPQLPLYEHDEHFLKVCREKQITLFLHPDRQYLIPLGTPKEIEEKIQHYADYYHKQKGGGIFYVEIENDAPFENVEALVRAVDTYR